MPKKVISVEQMRHLERYLMDKQRVCSLVLMENAGRSVAEQVAKRIKAGAHVLVVCGLGNNGGDGYVAARHLFMMGFLPTIWSLGDPRRLSGDAKTNYEAAMGSDIPMIVIEDEERLSGAITELGPVDAVVDAIFGIGLDRVLEGMHLSAVRGLNAQHAPIFSVDIPSGIHADTGAVMGEAVRASYTVTFQHAKTGHLLFPGRSAAGELLVVPLGFVSPQHLGGSVPEWMMRADLELLPKRKLDAHKGEFGRALLVAGSVGMMGAGIMAARAALRSGVGLLTLAVPVSAASAVWAAVPEAMAYPLPDKEGRFSAHSVEGLKPLLEGKSVAAIGPGLAHSTAHLELIKLLLNAHLPLVIDADGLNALSEDITVLKNAKADVVLTPHPGEMARLCKTTLSDILDNPVERVKSLARKTGVTVLLKGATSVIAHADKIAFNTSGSPALAKGGSGDVLTGIILALLAQGLCGYDAARLGSLLLGLAAESVDKPAECVLPTDVIEAIPKAMQRQ